MELQQDEGTMPIAEIDQVIPQLILEGKNYWPPKISLRALEKAVKRLLGEECEELRPFDFGMYHAIVKIKLCSGRVIIARIVGGVDPWFKMSSPFLPPFRQASEVATMRYVREHTTIPVPEIYATDEDDDGAVGGAFTLQEYISGDNLLDIWPSLSLAAQMHAMEQIADFALQLFHLEFPMIGSLQHTFDQAHDKWDYFVGPMVTMEGLPNSSVVGPPLDPGPWTDARGWLKSVARGGLLYEPTVPKKVDEEHIRRVTALVEEPESDNGLPADGDLAVCGLDHTDFGLHQIMARLSEDASKVELIAVLDWEAAQVLPRWYLGQGLAIKSDDEIADIVLRHCDTIMLKDPLYDRAGLAGRKARKLYLIARCATFITPDYAEVERFIAGDWEENSA